jgi:hypothetical protein
MMKLNPTSTVALMQLPLLLMITMTMPAAAAVFVVAAAAAVMMMVMMMEAVGDDESLRAHAAADPPFAAWNTQRQHARA